MFCSNTAINLVIISILVLQIKYGYSSTIERVDNGENDNEDIDEFLLKHIEEQCIQKCPDQVGNQWFSFRDLTMPLFSNSSHISEPE